jgi:hypothetical protein
LSGGVSFGFKILRVEEGRAAGGGSFWGRRVFAVTREGRQVAEFIGFRQGDFGLGEGVDNMANILS